MIQHTKTLLWRALALVCMALGVIGLLLPVVPTVPFLLAAAWAGGKGWPALEAWLLAHPQFGPPIRDWRAHGAVPRKAKWLASVMMCGSATILWFAPVPPWLRWGVYATMASVCLWLWLRPEPPPASASSAASPSASA
jgi:uncharacterized protein